MKLHTLSRRTFCKLLSLGAAAGIGGAIPFMSTKTFASANTTPKSLIVYFSHSGNTKKNCTIHSGNIKLRQFRS